LGLFWLDDSECDSYLDGLKELIDANEPAEKMVVCAVSADRARKYADIVIEEIGEKLSEMAVYLYSSRDNLFYRYDKSVVDKEVIWPELIDDSEDIESEEIVEAAQQIEESDLKVIEDGDDDKSIKIAEVKPVEPVEIEHDADFEKNIYKFLISRKYYCVPPYVKTLVSRNMVDATSYEQVAYALNDPMRHCTYSADGVFDIISGDASSLSDYYVTAIGLRTFFSNQVRYDYNIRGLYNAIKEIKVEESMVSAEEKLNLNAIKASLKSVLNVDGPIIDEQLVRQFVSKVIMISKYEYRWILNLSGKEYDPSVDDDAEIQSTMTLTFAQARAWRLRNGDYIRNRQWQDLIVDIRVI